MKAQKRDSRWLSLWLPLLLLGLALIPALLPFLKSGYFWNANDARHDAYFIFEYNRAVQDGVLFPRWLPEFTFGFGYPLFDIYAPLATQVGEALHLFGWGFTQAVKGVFILSILFSALAMFGFMRSGWGAWPALVAAVAYVYAPYHLMDMYQRAAMAESFSFVWMPLVLWGLRASARSPGWASAAGLGGAYAGLMLTSNLVAVLFTPVAVGYALILLVAGGPSWRKRVNRLLAMGLGALAGLGLSAWFWLPALLEFKYVNQSQWYGGYYDFHRHFVYFFQLFSPRWGFGISVPGPDDVISYQLGVVLYLFALAGVVVVARGHGRERRLTGGYALVVAAVATFLTTGASVWLWDHVPGVAFAQFPWRYLMLTVIALSVLVGLGHTLLRGGLVYWTLASIILLVLGSAAYLNVEVVKPLPEQGPVGLPALMRFQASEDEMTGVTVFARKIPHWSGLAEIMVRGKDVRTRVEFGHVQQDPALKVEVLGYRSNEDRIRYRAEGPGHTIVFNREMFPGWAAYVYDAQGHELQRIITWQEMTIANPYGLVAVPVPEGTHVLVLRFEDTPPRRTGKEISILTLLAMLAVPALRRLL